MRKRLGIRAESFPQIMYFRIITFDLMLKPEQLRKGNLVLNRKRKIVPVEIEDLIQLELWHTTRPDKNPPIKQVLLTKDLMLAFGFIESKGEYYLNDFEIKVLRNDVMKIWIVLFYDFNSCEFIHLTAVKHAHQLQNTYYTLFNSELKYEH